MGVGLRRGVFPGILELLVAEEAPAASGCDRKQSRRGRGRGRDRGGGWRGAMKF
jgi:hypothetical protein